MSSENLPASGSSPRPFFSALDGLRAVAVTMVFLVHFLPEVAPWGWVGVQIFFVLSGFLITGILYRSRNEPHRFRNFYARRSLRIFPLYYGFLFLMTLVMVVARGHAMPYFWLWFVDLQNFFWLLTNGNAKDVLVLKNGLAFTAIGHFWTLAVEEQFYLLWPLLIYAVKDRKRIVWLTCLLILGRMALAAYWQTHLSTRQLAIGIPYRMLPTQCDSFLLGGLLALWLSGSPSENSLALARRWSYSVAGVVLATFALLHIRPSLIGGQEVFSYTSAFNVVFGLPLINIVSLAFVLLVVQPGTLPYKICNLSGLRSLGRVSYGFYIFHLPVLVVLNTLSAEGMRHFQLTTPSLAIAIAGAVITAVVAYASFYYFEQPILSLKSRFANASTAKSVEA